MLDTAVHLMMDGVLSVDDRHIIRKQCSHFSETFFFLDVSVGTNMGICIQITIRNLYEYHAHTNRETI